MVQRVRQDQAIRNELGNGRNAGLVRYITGCEDERRFLAVQIGKLTLQRATLPIDLPIHALLKIGNQP